MYPPNPSVYTRLPTDPEEAPPSHQKYLHKVFFSRSLHLRTYLRLRWILVAAIFLLTVLAHVSRGYLQKLKFVLFPSTAYAFSSTSRPAYLDIIPPEPLMLRVAIMSRRDEFDKRQALRNYVVSGIPKTDVHFEYRFFVGVEKGNTSVVMGAVEGAWSGISQMIEDEKRVHGDVIILKDVEDIPERLSEKRYSAVKWAGDVPSSTYDYLLTLDSDTFCRLGAFARHLPALFISHGIMPPPNPRKSPILIGRLMQHSIYYLNTVHDGDGEYSDPIGVDQEIWGPSYPYPGGLAYMISSSLVSTIISASPPLPHHIHYPSDDVMIGAWIAGLRYFPSVSSLLPSSTFEPPHAPSPFSSLSPPVAPRGLSLPSPELIFSSQPTPYLPYPVNTTVLDHSGLHDYPGRGGNDAVVSWGSVCVHRISISEMRHLRAMEGVRGEWV